MVDKDNDPAAAWQTMFGEMSKGFSAFAQQAIAAPEFGKVAQQVGGISAEAHKQFAEMMDNYLAGMNLPSRAQMQEFNARLARVERRLDELAATVQAPTPSKPKGSA
jgi:BMFP domain-containing protein YqiC